MCLYRIGSDLDIIIVRVNVEVYVSYRQFIHKIVNFFIPVS